MSKRPPPSRVLRSNIGERSSMSLSNRTNPTATPLRRSVSPLNDSTSTTRNKPTNTNQNTNTDTNDTTNINNDNNNESNDNNHSEKSYDIINGDNIIQPPPTMHRTMLPHNLTQSPSIIPSLKTKS